MASLNILCILYDAEGLSRTDITCFAICAGNAGSVDDTR